MRASVSTCPAWRLVESERERHALAYLREIEQQRLIAEYLASFPTRAEPVNDRARVKVITAEEAIRAEIARLRSELQELINEPGYSSADYAAS